MLKVTLRGLLAHKLRLLLTAFSVVLGIAFVAGTFVLTDTINGTFDRIFTQANAGVAVTVQGKPLDVIAPGEGGGADPQRSSLPLADVARVRAVPGVAEAAPSVVRSVTLLDRAGKPIGNGAPTFGGAWISSSRLAAYSISAGRIPAGPRDVVVDATTVKAHGFTLGDTLRIVTSDGTARPFTLVGTAIFGTGGSLGGATAVLWDLGTAQQVLDEQGTVDTIRVASAAGVADGELRNRIAATLGTGVEVQTGADAARQQAQDIEASVSVFGTVLLVFAGVSLFVGCFIIVNTFSILVAQRMRELALLRALGARRRQVLASIMAEALITGLVASLAGVGLGVLIAKGLVKLADSTGNGIPADSIVVKLRTVIIGVSVGTLITLISALLPARRAMRVSPMAALRESVPESGRVTRARVLGGAAVLALGITSLGFGLFGSSGNRLAELGFGTVVSFFGVAVLSPLIVSPLVHVIGVPIAGLLGVPGRLARDNAARSPRRTASTAAALMTGIALVACVSTLAASFKASLADAVGGVMQAQVMVQPQGQAQGFSPTLAAVLRADSRFRDVEQLRNGVVKIDGAPQQVSAVDSANRAATLKIDVITGDAGGLGSGTVLISDTAAANHGWAVGSVVSAVHPDGAVVPLTVAAVYKHNLLLGDFVVDLGQYSRHVPLQQDSIVFLNGAAGASAEQTQRSLNDVLRGYPTVESQTQAQVITMFEKSIDSVLVFLDVLLALSLIIAVLGIVNTLALSVIERTRELGLLRALGLTRRQTRRMVRWESVIVALLGALLGMVVGVLLGAAVVHALAAQGFNKFALASGQLGGAAVVAFIFGVIAAIFPARRASRLRLLDALAAE